MDIAISGEAQVKWSNSTSVKSNFPENSIKESFTSEQVCFKAKEIGHRDIEKKKEQFLQPRHPIFCGALSPTHSLAKNSPKYINKR